MAEEDGARFAGTVATVRRALERSFTGRAEGDAGWRGAVGPARRPVAVDVVPHVGAPLVRVSADVAPVGAGAARLPRVALLEHEHLVFARFRREAETVVAEQVLLGGPTLHADEVRLTAWAVAWTAASYERRLTRLLADDADVGPPPEPTVAGRRGEEERVASAQERVERLLRSRYGGFERDPTWGYHGAFGSSRVFVSVAPYLEISTVVLVAAPVLLDVDLDDGLAVDAYRLVEAGPLGRPAYSPARRELWVEHAVLGDDLDARELEAAVDAVAALADGEDDRLQARHGGRRVVDGP